MHRRLTVPMPLRRVRDTLSEGSRTVRYLAALPRRVRLMEQTVCLLRTQTITSSSFQVTAWRESYRTAARLARRYVTAFVDARRFEDSQGLGSVCLSGTDTGGVFVYRVGTGMTANM